LPFSAVKHTYATAVTSSKEGNRIGSCEAMAGKDQLITETADAAWPEN
jgi:hypothetical protein